MKLLIPKVIFTLAISMLLTMPAYAKSAMEIDASVQTALMRFKNEVPGARDLLSQAKGVLVVPGVVKAGFVLGGEYGEGALQIDGKTVDYYNTVGGSFGLQLGAQVKDVFLLFMNDNALNNFRYGEGWEVGVDGSVALIAVGAEGSLDTTKTNQPILGFVISQKGLMYNLTLEGSKFNKIVK